MEFANFDLNSLLEQVLATGKEYVEKGQELAEEKLDIPASGEEREVMLDGLKKGAIASAVLVGLLGTRGGRKLTGTAVKLGGLAALGAAAYKGYQSWQGENVSEQELADDRALVVIMAMVSAANADGKVDSQEQITIKHEILKMHLPEELAMSLAEIIDRPLSASELAGKVTDPILASEVYLAVRLLIDEHSSPSEKAYLEELVVALQLSHELTHELDQQVI